MADEYVELVESDDDFNEFDDADVSDYVGYGEQEEDLSEDGAIAAQMDASDETSSPFLEPDFPEVTEAEDGEAVEIAESDGDDEDEFDVIGDEGVTEFGAMSEDEDLSEDDAIAAQMDTSEEDVIELDYDSPENPDTIECDCICAVKTGDRVMVQLVNGEPTVIGVVGWGDALQSDVDAAKGSAKEAHDAAVAAQEDAAAANASAQSAEASARAASESAGNAIAQAQRAEDAAVAAEGLARTANASAIEAAMRASDAGRSASVAQAALGSMTVDWHDYIAEVIDGEWAVYHKDDASKTNVIGSISMVWQDKDGLHIVGEKGRLDIEQSGITISDSAGAVLASFGSSATIGNDAGGKFVMSDSSLSAYDKGTKYFEVTKDGMKFGLFDVASKGYADTAKSEAISAAASDATSKVNAIQIGGRNLVKNSVWVADGNYSDYKWSKIASRVDAKVGETYTFSFYFNDSLDTTTDHGYGYIHAFDADGNVVARDYFSTASESQRTKTVGNGIAYLIAYAGVRNCVVGDVYKLKLEAGNKATDWTPAPEDVEADAVAKADAAKNAAIAAAGSAADSKIEAATANMATTDDIPTKVSDLDNDSGFQNASQVQSTANTAKGEAITAAASDATSKADAALADAKEYVSKSMQFTADGLEIADMRNGSPVGTRAVLGADALEFKNGNTKVAEFSESRALIGYSNDLYQELSYSEWKMLQKSPYERPDEVGISAHCDMYIGDSFTTLEGDSGTFIVQNYYSYELPNPTMYVNTEFRIVGTPTVTLDGERYENFYVSGKSIEFGYDLPECTVIKVEYITDEIISRDRSGSKWSLRVGPYDEIAYSTQISAGGIRMGGPNGGIFRLSNDGTIATIGNIASSKNITASGTVSNGNSVSMTDNWFFFGYITASSKGVRACIPLPGFGWKSATVSGSASYTIRGGSGSTSTGTASTFDSVTVRNGGSMLYLEWTLGTAFGGGNNVAISGFLSGLTVTLA